MNKTEVRILSRIHELVNISGAGTKFIRKYFQVVCRPRTGNGGQHMRSFVIVDPLDLIARMNRYLIRNKFVEVLRDDHLKDLAFLRKNRLGRQKNPE